VIFWYTQSPDDMLDSLLEMEATAVELRTPCTHDDVKSMFSTPVLPKTPGFATGKPSAIAKVFFLWIRCFFFFLTLTALSELGFPLTNPLISSRCQRRFPGRAPCGGLF
jgi:hypothetical protein